jgi:hypothetical protein
MRSIPARLSVVLLLAVLVGVAGGASPFAPADTRAANATVDDAVTANNHPPYVERPPNTTSYLKVSDDSLTETGYATTGVDVPGSIAFDRERLAVDIATESFESRFEDASSANNRTAAVTAATAQFEGFVDSAQQRQRTAIRRYSDGEINSQGLLRTLARTHATAIGVEDGIDRVREVGNDPLDYGIGGTTDTRLTNIEPELVTVSGELRELFRATAIGQLRTDDPVYIEASGTDVVVATILNDNYLRESYIAGEYNRTFGVEGVGVAQRIQELYTWAYRPENYVGGSVSLNRVGNTSVWRSRVTHRQGQFEIHFDANTDGVFKERQTKRLRDAEPLRTQSVVNGSLRLVVNDTHDTGPMEVRLLDAGDGQPRNGTVFVGGTRVGTTGDDGRLWTVDARGDSVVRVVTAEERVSMFVYDS